MTTKELDRIARERIEQAGAKPAFLGYRGYPASAVRLRERRGRPRHPQRAQAQGRRHRRARPWLRGRRASTATPRARWPWGAISDDAPPPHEGDRGGPPRGHRGRAGPASGWATSATPSSATPRTTATRWCGSSWATGSGPSLHEEPQVPNYGPAGRRERLVPGMCLAIEPMVNAGGHEVRDAGRRLDGGDRGRQPVRPLRAVTVAVTPPGTLDPLRAVPVRGPGGGGGPCLRRRWRWRRTGDGRRCRTRSTAWSSRARPAVRSLAHVSGGRRRSCGCSRGTRWWWSSCPTT